MKLLRRDFVKWSLLSAWSFPVSGLAKGHKNINKKPKNTMRKTGPSIIQGATDDSKTQFSVVHTSREELIFMVTDDHDRQWLPDVVEFIKHPGQSRVISKPYFSNLEPNKPYQLNVFDHKLNQQIDQREFQTIDLNKKEFKFALCSCMHDDHHDHKIWRDLVQQKPDVIFFVGDSVYADYEGSRGVANPQKLWRRFSESRQTLDIYYSKKLIPILATWDDHDFGKNDSDKSYPYIKESQKNFLSFFAQNESHCDLIERGPGVSTLFRYKNQQFFLLDDRSYREPRGSSKRYAHWGEEQERWMLSHMSTASGVNWLMNGTQIFPSMWFKESVSKNHKQQLVGILSELKKCPTKTIFVSGDVHYSEISQIEKEQIGYETFEITSSSIHSPHFPGVPGIVPNKRRIASTNKRNYILITSKEVGLGVKLELESRSHRGSFFKGTLGV